MTQDKSLLSEVHLPGLAEIVGDEEVAKAVLKAARSSMGMDTSEQDMANILVFTQRMISLALYRKQLYAYLEEKMATVAPNLSTLIGETVAARLIQKAGSLTSLAKAPASTVQILGAEKALFRALKTKGNTPKYGLIYHSSFIGRASAKNKGRISRYLANKCAIASRIDSFIEEPTNAYGLELRDQVEERLRFYDSGDLPRKNVDVMTGVADGLRKIASQTQKKIASNDLEEGGGVAKEEKKKASKKDKKRGRDEEEEVAVVVAPVVEEEPVKKKKSKKVCPVTFGCFFVLRCLFCQLSFFIFSWLYVFPFFRKLKKWLWKRPVIKRRRRRKRNKPTHTIQSWSLVLSAASRTVVSNVFIVNTISIYQCI